MVEGGAFFRIFLFLVWDVLAGFFFLDFIFLSFYSCPNPSVSRIARRIFSFICALFLYGGRSNRLKLNIIKFSAGLTGVPEKNLFERTSLE